MTGVEKVGKEGFLNLGSLKDLKIEKTDRTLKLPSPKNLSTEIKDKLSTKISVMKNPPNKRIYVPTWLK